ncbi:MAG: carboxypeptidase-like regulatory domain-containing protein, partial [Armatimonadota bacterium]
SVLVESWNELWEGTAFSRCNDFPKRTGGYTSPTYYMDVAKQQIMAARDRAGVPTSLQNGGMETYTNGVANSWTPFWLYGDVTYGAESTFKYSGSYAQRMTSVWQTHFGGVYQRLAATSGTKYTASVHSWRSDPWNNANVNQETWIGIDPAGGVDPTASTIVWSSSKHSYRTWTQQVVTAQATSNRITVFLRARANYGGSDMRAVFDNVTLSNTTLGTITGYVRDANNNPISGATVSTTGYSTTTNSSGAYTLSNVNPGEYTVTASKSGYASQAKSALVANGASVTLNFNLTAAATEKVQNGNMEGGFFNTGWGSNCSSAASRLPNPSGVWGWNNEPSYPFNTFQSTTIKRDNNSLGFAFCATAASPGKMGIVWQNVNLGSPNATATFSVWAYHTDGNCPSIMCWNPGQNQSNPYTANSAGRYQWVTTDNWGQRNMWLNRSMTVQADSSGYVTIMVGGAAHPGTASGAKLYIDDVSVK